MMTYNFREIHPKRTYNKHHTDYHKYKEPLAIDFNYKCGYTNCSDFWFGGIRCFQIDHLKPFSKYPEKETDYSNLVYCCSYVNRAKWDDDNDNYLDPCTIDYNNHFYRDKFGIIIAKTPEAMYMVEHLHLNMQRYAIIWLLDQLDDKIAKLRNMEFQNQDVKELLPDLYKTFYEYVQRLKSAR